MRLTELWELVCVCGASVSSTTPAFVCHVCGRHGRFERPECACRVTVPVDRTLSEKEGVK